MGDAYRQSLLDVNFRPLDPRGVTQPGERVPLSSNVCQTTRGEHYIEDPGRSGDRVPGGGQHRRQSYPQRPAFDGLPGVWINEASGLPPQESAGYTTGKISHKAHVVPAGYNRSPIGQKDPGGILQAEPERLGHHIRTLIKIGKVAFEEPQCNLVKLRVGL
ncbi:MAG: hypothetical protein DDT28_01224 [Dehalococcoidia bacterium]|nr:hypothetical protein [Chloroflexota bacterium]